jgi:16S rRNA (cytosine1402-N4)-methyltransferase
MKQIDKSAAKDKGLSPKSYSGGGLYHHQPVLLEETIRALDPKPGESYLDGTAGFGGHAEAVIERIAPEGRAVLVDRDREAIAALRERFGDHAEIVRGNYLEVSQRLLADGSTFDMILLDLGVSSPQLDQDDRGFSFHSYAKLDMRMDRSQTLSAADVVNTYSEARLAQLIGTYGEERRAKAVAQAIVQHRPITTARELAQVVRRVVRQTGDTDAATRTFQAIRIEVNAELTSLESVLPILVQLLVPGGRLAVISFHSLEDRIVKQFIDRESRDCICPPKQPICTCDHQATLTKAPRQPIRGETQDVSNPRSRSATLRGAVKKNRSQEQVTKANPAKTKGGDS